MKALTNYQTPKSRSSRGEGSVLLTMKKEYRKVDVSVLDEILWSDKKRPFFGLPLSFTHYSLHCDRLLIDRGLLIRRQEEIRLYRVVDLSLRQSLFQRLFKVGTIIVQTVDCSAPKYLLAYIRQPYEVMRLISDTSEIERRRVGIGFFETFHF